MQHTNGAYSNRQPQPYYGDRQRTGDNRYPDESWQVGDSDVECSVWIARGRNAGEQYLDIRRVSDEGKQLKTFRVRDLRHFYQGLAEHAARLSQQEDLSEEERDAMAVLADGTVELLENTPRVNSKETRRHKRPRRS